ncbi:hypothetical protein LEN26_007127 [Aphanomyces euteiches]|nr:hypothetical protein AeMF1_010290 [Aphanomyces euteiches]KAH9133235.1 hypothetical protein LEN26_007127 [Aphanomyces euteiches]KAH9190854.1 hypothetical protein AeNC1_007168 [Aphanomyces euteiches]
MDESNLSPQQKNEVIARIRAEVQQQGFQELTQAVQEKCFNKCVTRPQERLDSKQQQCLSLCIERYIDTMKVVSSAMTSRGNRG